MKLPSAANGKGRRECREEKGVDVTKYVSRSVRSRQVTGKSGGNAFWLVIKVNSTDRQKYKYRFLTLHGVKMYLLYSQFNQREK